MKHRKNYRGDKILNMLILGKSYKEICKAFNIKSGTISFYKKKFGLQDNTTWQCFFCKKEFKNVSLGSRGNHSRWCLKNPDRNKYIKRDTSQMLTPEAMTKKRKSISNAWKKGCYDNVDFGKSFLGKKHSLKSIEQIRHKALNSKHRRLVKSTRTYIRLDGTSVLLDSSWEEALAKRLDVLKIEWIRPETPLPWLDSNNIQHNYFPDFYLPKYNVYLDPKNPAAYLNQKEKINFILKNYKNIIFLKTLEECNRFIINQGQVAERFKASALRAEEV